MTPNFSRTTATGLNGERYEFQVYPAGTEFRQLPGLYFLGHPTAQGGWYALYIGQTHDLQMRVGAGLQNHHQFSAAMRLGFTHVGVNVFTGNERTRLGAEANLIARLRPKLNGNGGQRSTSGVRVV